MLIVTPHTKMSEYTQNTVAINSPMSLTFHILHSHFTRSGKAARVNSAVEAPSPEPIWGEVLRPSRAVARGNLYVANLGGVVAVEPSHAMHRKVSGAPGHFCISRYLLGSVG
jgi:hypothetical protein